MRSEKNSEDTHQRSHSIFDDPSIVQASKEDPFVDYVRKNWSNLLTWLVVLGAVLWGIISFRETQQTKRENLSMQFGLVREAYRGYLATKTPDTKPEDAAAAKLRLEKVLEALGDATTPPYPQIVRFYRGLVALKEGDFSRVQTLLSATAWDVPVSEKGAAQLYDQLTALALGRGMLDLDQTRVLAKETLFALAEKGTLVAAAAAKALAAVAEGPEDTARLKKALESIKSRAPEQEKFLTEELDALNG